MPDPTPAAVLRTAAATLRTASRAAGSGEWAADHFPEGTVVRPADSTHSLFQLHADGNRAAGTPCVTRPVGDWIALMDPGMGPLLADWLERQADTASSTAWCTNNPDQDIALALARAVNTKEKP